MQPEREARHCYAKLKQTGSVKEFVREQSQIVCELEGTPFYPGGGMFDEFINGLELDVALTGKQITIAACCNDSGVN